MRPIRTVLTSLVGDHLGIIPVEFDYSKGNKTLTGLPEVDTHTRITMCSKCSLTLRVEVTVHIETSLKAALC